MFNPKSTYRIQFNKEFTFRNLRDYLEYIFLLGPGSIYASPVFGAAPGSMHGYDVTSPVIFNPEIGGYDEFTSLSVDLQTHDTGWIQDIVPNHMAFHRNNTWLMDVLEKGKKSAFYRFFDIDLSHPDCEGKIIVPFLGKSAKEAVEAKEVLLGWTGGNFCFAFYGSRFPCNFETFRTLVSIEKESIPLELKDALRDFIYMESVPEGFLDNEWEGIKRRVGELYTFSGKLRNFINSILALVNARHEHVADLLDSQHYRLTFWKESLHELNYRRFFTVNELICLNMHDEAVFKAWHELVSSEVNHKRFNGLRIDHIDGLHKPSYYLEKLRLLAGDGTYIVAEKILGHDEVMPAYMPIQGTSGYDYLGIVNNLFTYGRNYPLLKDFYTNLTGITGEIGDIIYEKKKLILAEWMVAEWENLTRMFEETGLLAFDPDLNRESVKAAIGEFLVTFPVYRLYSENFPLSHEDTEIVADVISKASQRYPGLTSALKVLGRLFLELHGGEPEKKALEFFLRCMQFTGPLMAKGVEDTTMYYYNCFICHNEVGDHPGSEGISAEKYHELMLQRQKYRPMSMNATSTHDTKRGEDARARLNVISEIPSEWIKHVRTWIGFNARFKTMINGSPAPDANEEYFIYQTLYAVYPFRVKEAADIPSRMRDYLVKALREGKSNSSWNDPDESYEQAVIRFTDNILAKGSDFLGDFIPFLQNTASYGAVNSISQLVLKATSPGIPDFYQGTELWDFSLVDPDNRRQVDFGKRLKLLRNMVGEAEVEEEPGNMFKELFRNINDGRLKLWMTHQLLKARRSHPELFLHGRYIPLKTSGKYAEHVLSFARVYENEWLITVIPLYLAATGFGGKFPWNIKWEDTAIELPEFAPSGFSSSTGLKIKLNEKVLVSEILEIPCAVFLYGVKPELRRFAGVLAHVSSLPGKYGSGDLGEEAYDFADMLCSNGQKYWQILPFNPVGEGYAWSPYSSISAFAGNTMFISPGLLAGSRLVSPGSLARTVFRETNRTSFRKAIDFRNMILDEAFTGFFCNNLPYRQWKFEEFCIRESHWLDDYALFSILKQEFAGVPWNEWPAGLRNRNAKSLEEVAVAHESELKKEKFSQYIFQEQWIALKKYCNNLGIKLIGDVSFYVNYDSADVWSHPGYFSIDRYKRPVKVAGVPPDFFSSTGQLWNMPVYNWKAMEKDGFRWWIDRIRRNAELCDLVRFDHFRGFSEYWEVPWGETTAVNGKWVEGPGEDFFERVMEEFPGMPFIAEDLGSIDEKVYKLRDDFSLPGMAVLQFAFGENTPQSDYIPHNYKYNSIVYTGTHDNNTTKGWYLNELDDALRRIASEYIGHPVKKEKIHCDFIRLAYASIAKIAIIPVQDLLGLDERARLNTPSTSEKNWDWKLRRKDLPGIFPEVFRRMLKIYGRI
jgi:malto-oligosyltrehalose synthase/4-alpha-glucanotransferase